MEKWTTAKNVVSIKHKKYIAINDHENKCIIWVLKTFLDII